MASVALIVGCSTYQVPAPPGDNGNHEEVRAAPVPGSSIHCGLERWPVKTGTDSQAPSIDLTNPTPTTIAQMTQFAAPSYLPQASRIAPVETNAFTLTATLK